MRARGQQHVCSDAGGSATTSVGEAPVRAVRLEREYVLRSGRLRRERRVVRALDGVSFEVAPGELFGLVGPNGAGKTTTIRILTTLLVPTRGSAFVLGLDVTRRRRELRRRIGILFGGERGLYGRVSAWQNLRYFANLHALPADVSARRIAEVLALTGLEQRAHDRVDTFSRGMKQRLHIARALLHDPEVLFLDEPTIGLDPLAAAAVRELVATLRERGRTILLTTHYMLEADALCDRVGIIDHGRLLAVGSPRELRRLVPDLYVIEVEVLERGQEAAARLRSLAGSGSSVELTERDGRRTVQVQSARGAELVSEIADALADLRHGPLLLREPTLEDVYLRVVRGGEEIAGELIQV